MSFLPTNYKSPSASTGRYTRFKKGSNRLRISGDSERGTAIFGWEGWTEDEEGKPSPRRFPMSEKPAEANFRDRIKHFWAFLVWNCDESSMQICQITQRSVQDSIKELMKDEDWGDLKEYDIVIDRQGDGLETTYSTIPKPKAPLDDAAVAVIKEELPKVRMEALFANEDPFAQLEGGEQTDTAKDPF